MRPTLLSWIASAFKWCILYCLLEVVFTSGRTYCYEGVPPAVHQGLMAADSKGQYMRAAIIGVYPDYPVTRRRRR